MRRLTTLQALIDRAREANMDPRDLAIDEDDVFDVQELDADVDQNPDDES
jgi:hypothetical protein